MTLNLPAAIPWVQLTCPGLHHERIPVPGVVAVGIEPFGVPKREHREQERLELRSGNGTGMQGAKIVAKAGLELGQPLLGHLKLDGSSDVPKEMWELGTGDRVRNGAGCGSSYGHVGTRKVTIRSPCLHTLARAARPGRMSTVHAASNFIPTSYLYHVRPLKKPARLTYWERNCGNKDAPFRHSVVH